MIIIKLRCGVYKVTNNKGARESIYILINYYHSKLFTLYRYPCNLIVHESLLVCISFLICWSHSAEYFAFHGFEKRKTGLFIIEKIVVVCANAVFLGNITGRYINSVPKFCYCCQLFFMLNIDILLYFVHLQYACQCTYTLSLAAAVAECTCVWVLLVKSWHHLTWCVWWQEL